MECPFKSELMTKLPEINSFWRSRLVAFGWHLGISLGIAGLCAVLVFGLWYPYPYREVSGGQDLFLLVISVDVVLGPLITLAVFNRKKSWRELKQDLAVVAALQLAALGYGLWTVALARPVHLVFELDRFRVVHAIDIPEELLNQVPAGITAKPVLGPSLLGIRPFKDAIEKRDATWLALQGRNMAARPDLWQTYATSVPSVLQAARPVAELKTRFAGRSDEIDAVLSKIGRTSQNTLYLPMVARTYFWTTFLDPVTADVLAFMPLDSF
jgi:hypothetical protein